MLEYHVPVNRRQFLSALVVCACLSAAALLGLGIRAQSAPDTLPGEMSDKDLMAALESFKPENSPARAEITTMYAATVNQPIPDDAFDFHPDA